MQRSFLLFLAACGAAPTPTGSTTSFQIQSQATGDAYDIHVRVPEGYDATTETYAVVYQLDANFLDQQALTAQTISLLEAENRIAKTIIVGIGHTPGSRGRFIDFVPSDPRMPKETDGAERFFRFVHDELVPRIERDYRTNQTRAMVGHSLGGLFTLYAFFQDEADGTPFLTHALASDPSYGTNEGAIFAYEAAYANKMREGRLFLTASTFTGATQKICHDEMARRFEEEFGQLTFLATYERNTHGEVLLTGIEDGIPFILGANP